MVKKTPAPKYSDVLVGDIKSWAQKRKVADDEYLNELIKAIEYSRNLSYWASYKQIEWLPKPKSLKALKLSTLGRYIAIVRNVLIFLPVAITWFAIGEATRAFEIYIATGGEATANFLEFWQKGGGGLAEEWEIGNVATTDFQIILVLILLSLISGILQNRAIKISSADKEIYEQERISLAIKIDLYLVQYKKVTPLTLTKEVAAIIDRLNNSARMIESSLVKMGNADLNMANVEKGAQTLSSAVLQMQNFLIKNLKPILKKSTLEVQKYDKNLSDINKNLERDSKILNQKISSLTKRLKVK
jgi:hypothetical protein